MRTPALCERSTHTNVCTRLHKCVCLCALRPLHLLSLEHSSCLSGNTRVRVCVCACVCVCVCVLLSLAPQPGSLVHEISRQGYWSGLPFPSPGDLANPGIKSRSLALQKDSLPSEPPGKPNYYVYTLYVRVYVCVYIYNFLGHTFWHMGA